MASGFAVGAGFGLSVPSSASSMPMARALILAPEPATARPWVMAASASWPRRSATMAALRVRTGARFTLNLSASLTLAAFRTLHGKRHLGGSRMSRWTREQRFDLRVLIAIALLIFVVSVLMLTVGRDMFWGAVG